MVCKIRDQHNRLVFFTPTTLLQHQKVAGDAFTFSSYNPTGHYFLKLDNPVHRDVAKVLLYINKQNFDRIVKGEAFDRSQWGNKSCFRNETINKGELRWSPAFVLPQTGIFEFDFIYLTPSRGLKEAHQLQQEQLEKLVEWFKIKLEQLIEHQEKERELLPTDTDKIKAQKEAMPPIRLFNQELAQTFGYIADFITLSTQQLAYISDANQSDEWRIKVLTTGAGRCHDCENIDMIKHYAKSPEVSKMLYQRVGILNMFSLLRPNGEYELNLSIYEEKQVAKLLCELAKAEGWGFMTDIKLAGATVEKMSADVMRALPDAGKFVCKYECPEEKVKADVRQKMGQKYFEWPQ